MNARGYTMMEVLVALLLITLAVTTVLALALGGFTATAEARRTELAVGLAADLAGRTRALPTVDWTALPAPTPCAVPCAPERYAALELSDWLSDVAATLPAGTGLLATGAGGELVLTLSWTETGGDPRELRMGIAR